METDIIKFRRHLYRGRIGRDIEEYREDHVKPGEISLNWHPVQQRHCGLRACSCAVLCSIEIENHRIYSGKRGQKN